MADWLRTRQTKYASYAAVYIIVVIAVLAAINFLANRYDKSYDSTANKQFSLSDQTLKVVKGLPRDIRLTYFGATNEFGGAKDLLERYSSLSPKLHVEYIDPERKPQVARAAGYRSDSPVVVDSGVRKEGAKSLTEEEITGALIRSLKSGERNVCFLTAGGEHTIEDSSARGYSYLKQLLERDNYKVRSVDLKPKAMEAPKSLTVGQAPPPAGAVDVPKDCSVLIIGGPQTDYTQPVVTAIKSYIEAGGRALIMLDQTLRLGSGATPSENADLTKLLSDWGVTANKDLVLDLSGVGQLFNLGPEVPLITSYESSPITQPLTRVPTAFPLVRSLTLGSGGGRATVSKLIATTEDSLAVDAIGAGGAIDPKKGKKGPHTIAVTATMGGSPQGRFVLVGSSLWAQNSLISSRQLGNRDLFGNMINWLSSDEDLISIRPKEREDRPLNITTAKINMLFWLSLVIFPLGVVAFGMATWWKRR
jgi:ABC-type uncharacterized transport system involved in gliding motility auxiliary subunit